MTPKTLRTLLLICVFLDIALIGVVVYDYFRNDSDWILIVLGVFAVFVLFTAILFATAVSQKGERVVVKEVVREVVRDGETAPLRFDSVQPIPPAPIHAPPIRAPLPPTRSITPAHAEPAGPFRFNGYTLHTRQVELAGAGGKRAIYFFSKKKPKSGRPCAKPAGYHVGVNERTGLPFLKRGAGPDGEDLTPAAAEPGYRPQCSALTEDGKQCRNSARGGSKYCGSHVGYQPKTLKGSAKKIEGEEWDPNDKLTDSESVRRADTKARVKGAPDTKPSTRKSIFARFKRSNA